ncbi:Iron-sulfur cluster assembly protein SufD [Fulvivirga imtechensis AK7]|uniref:Iron-sulfur cluster assembly protein SufD n=1 Tax=Fulvivirga imtechensis AK7 TaxID=1237149 RepID=L8JL60_9BACT|nr:Fe-S cluster assembly protein SufD [Fulvivirga imtechensis]ELR68968.1 Iron-sulfur cluster assembly protein SufD [Fulvivirga imtechensis AK7]
MSEVIKDAIEQEFTTNFEALEKRLNGASALPIHQVRKKAINAFQELGLPTARNEEYKYTDLKKALQKTFDFKAPSPQGKINRETIEECLIPGLDANILIFINGVFSNELSTIISPEDQLTIKDLEAATMEDKELIDNYFAQYANYEHDAFIALNTAFTEHGSFIHIPDNKLVEKPIALYFFNDAQAGKSYNQPRNLFIVGKSSQATFLEVFYTVGKHESFTNIVSEIVVNENANAEYYKIQNNRDTAFHVGTTQVWQARNSQFSAYTFTLNGAMIRNNLNIASDGEGCESHMYGLYLLHGKTHVDNHTEIDHIKPNSFSNELYKGIMEDQSHGVFNGKVYVRQAAQKTNAFQSNKNILLSDQATINSKPQLEIWADDVKCSHGCTTGQLDEEALFYLQSRGVSKERARVLLLYAFAVEVLENVKLEPLKAYLEDLISERLHKDF